MGYHHQEWTLHQQRRSTHGYSGCEYRNRSCLVATPNADHLELDNVRTKKVWISNDVHYWIHVSCLTNQKPGHADETNSTLASSSIRLVVLQYTLENPDITWAVSTPALWTSVSDSNEPSRVPSRTDMRLV